MLAVTGAAAARHPPSSPLALLRRLDALRDLLRASSRDEGGAPPVAASRRRGAASSAATRGDGAKAPAAAATPPTTTTTTTTTWTVTRAFSQADVDAFVSLTGDANPIHRADHDDGNGAAAAAPPKQPPPPPPLVPGLLLASLFPAIIGSRFSGAIYARQSLRFRSPARVGEAVVAVVSLAEKGERAGGGGKGEGGGAGGVSFPPASSRVAFDTVVRAEDGRVLVEGAALAIIPVEAQMRARGEARLGAEDARR